MASGDEFFTTQTLLTFGGATLATFVVPNALRVTTNNRIGGPKVGFIVAQLICFGDLLNTAMTGQGWPTVSAYLVAFINGCLVFTSATGTHAMASMGLGSQDAGQGEQQGAGGEQAAADKKTGDGKDAASPTLSGRVQKAFTPWF